MLITCKECELPVSDKAMNCPHCGYPIKSGKVQPNLAKSGKHKRLPNGFGQISRLNNPNLRNQYRAMITVGKNENGRPICKLLKPNAYFRTYNEAYKALVEYNKNPYDLETDMLVSALYEKWTESYFKTLKSVNSERTITSAWKYCSSVSNMRVKDIRARHIKGCIDAVDSPNIKSRIKSVFNLMLDYAVEFELTNINYARTFVLSEDVTDEIEVRKKQHISFTDEEMELLWSNINKPHVDLVVMQCYSGLRPQEIGLILKENVDLDKNIMVGGMKTKAGINRVIPIHSCIKNIIEVRLNSGKSKYLFTDEIGQKLTYDKYKLRFNNVIAALNINPEHRPHDPRKQFVTMAKKAGVDEYALKMIVGHKISDVTEAVYTDRPDGWLNEQIEKIKRDA